MQEDHFQPSMTCIETLRVAAALKCQGSSGSRAKVVEESLGAMGLSSVANTQVCVPAFTRCCAKGDKCM